MIVSRVAVSGSTLAAEEWSAASRGRGLYFRLARCSARPDVTSWLIRDAWAAAELSSTDSDADVVRRAGTLSLTS